MAAAEASGAREGITEIALQHAADPDQVAQHRRTIEADLALEGGDRFGRRRLAENGLGEIARQHGDRREDDDRDDEQRDEAEAEPLQHRPGDSSRRISFSRFGRCLRVIRLERGAVPLTPRSRSLPLGLVPGRGKPRPPSPERGRASCPFGRIRQTTSVRRS